MAVLHTPDGAIALQNPLSRHSFPPLFLSHQEAGEGKQGDPHVMAHRATSVDRLSCDITRLFVLIPERQ